MSDSLYAQLVGLSGGVLLLSAVLIVWRRSIVSRGPAAGRAGRRRWRRWSCVLGVHDRSARAASWSPGSC